MEIPIATVEPWDLVSIDAGEGFTLEFRVHGEPFVKNGRHWLEAWGTIAEMAAITSPDQS